MKIEPAMVQTSDAQSMRSSPDKAQPAREQESRQAEVVQNAEPDEKKVAPEEILDRIKEISRDGLYSVRFEKSDEINSLIVKVVNRETDEVIRQIPPEAILGVKANLMDYLGNIVNKYT